MNNTKHFSNCLGVFQGGGCRAAAFLGAYKEAYNRGVSFSEVVGNSAGSIFAAFVATGAKPDILEKVVEELDFKSFMQPPKSLNEYDPELKLIRKKISYLSYIPQVRKFIKNIGLYNSENIEYFVNNNLRDLLGINEDRDILFKDLNIPITIVSSDLRAKCVKVWSTINTPDESVANAVRCSCSIPFFFQPVSMQYVDGGMLSNLPTFTLDSHPIYDKILAFSMISEGKTFPPFSFSSYLTSLLETLTNGAIDIQLKLQKPIYIVKINTGEIKATDFEKMNKENIQKLIKSGERSMRKFLNDESTEVKDWITPVNICRDSFQMNTIISYISQNKIFDITISCKDTKWVYDIFTTILKWKIDESSIVVYIEGIDVKLNPEERESEEYRRRILVELGCPLIQKDSLPFYGYIINSNNEDAFAIIDNLNNVSGSYAKYYYGKEEKLVISLLKSELFRIEDPHPLLKTKVGQISLSYSKNIEEELVSKLKNTKQYQADKVSINMEQVEVEKLIFVTQYIRGYKYRQIDQLYNLYKDYGFECFHPVKLHFNDNSSSLITPPVVEEHNGEYLVIEGNTRIYYAYRNKIEKIFVAVVRNVNSPLPSTGRFKIEQVILTDKDKTGKDRYDDFDYKNFRKIEKSVRPPKTTLI